jgi:hypothetical protein
MAKASPPPLKPLRCGGCGCATVTLTVPPSEPCDAPNYIVRGHLHGVRKPDDHQHPNADGDRLA